jgi:hypothetical protein
LILGTILSEKSATFRDHDLHPFFVQHVRVLGNGIRTVPHACFRAIIPSARVCVHRLHYGSREERAVLEKQLVVGDTGPGTGNSSYPKALNDILGTKFRIVGVYPSSADVFLAMERGEVQGICESLHVRLRDTPRWRRVEPDSCFNGPDDFVERDHGKVRVGPEHDMAAVGMIGRRGHRLDLERDFVEGTQALDVTSGVNFT